MRRAHVFLAAALAVLPACSAIIGLKEVEEGNPDGGGASCQVNEKYELLQANDQTQGASVSPKGKEIWFALALNADSATDFFMLALRPGFGSLPDPIQVGRTYTISGDDTKFATCGVCALLATNFTSGGAFDGDDFYMASEGDVQLSNVNGRLVATLTNLKFRHVSISAAGTADAADGCQSEIQQVLINRVFDGTTTPDAGMPAPDAPPAADAGPTATVTGTVINNQLTENGEVQAPINAATLTIEALLLDGDKFTTYPGTGKTDGSFSIVTPQTTYRYIRVGTTYLVTNQLSTDFGQTDIGRTDGVQVGRESAYFSIVLDNVEKAKANDFFEIYVPNLDILGYVDAQEDQTFFDSSIWTNPSIDQTKNDRVYLTQLAGRTTAMGDPYWILSRYYAMPLFTTVAGETNSLPDAAFATVDPTFFATLDWRRLEFHGLTALVNPAATLDHDGLSVSAVPNGPRVDLQVGNAVDLFYSSRSDEKDVAFGAVPIGQPFPSNWERWLDHRSIFNISYMAMGAGEPVDFHAAMVRFDPLASLDGQPIKPGVLPVRAPQINGVSAFTTQNGVGTTPVVSWTPPDGATPTGYRVALYELYNDSGTSNFKFISQVFHPGLALKYPPGWLVPGRTYFFRITSFLAPSSMPNKAPYRRGLPTAEADTLSAVVTP